MFSTLLLAPLPGESTELTELALSVPCFNAPTDWLPLAKP